MTSGPIEGRLFFPASALIHLQTVPDWRNRAICRALEPLDIATTTRWRETSGETEETSHACTG